MPNKRKYERTVPKVLAYLSFRKANKWELAKKLGKSYSNIHKTIYQLLKHELIRVAKTKPSIKNPKVEVEYYDSTLKGLFMILKNPRLWKNIDKITDYHKDKLEMFREWKNFTQAEKECIKKELGNWYTDQTIPLSLDRIALFYSETELRDALDNFLIGAEVRHHKELHDIVKRNPDLRKKHLIKLHEELEQLKKFMDAVENEIAELE